MLFVTNLRVCRFCFRSGACVAKSSLNRWSILPRKHKLPLVLKSGFLRFVLVMWSHHNKKNSLVWKLCAWEFWHLGNAYLLMLTSECPRCSISKQFAVPWDNHCCLISFVARASDWSSLWYQSKGGLFIENLNDVRGSLWN
jgi:hypothetical protein